MSTSSSHTTGTGRALPQGPNGVPLLDLHVHVEEGLSLPRALQLSRERGVRFGIVEHGGYGQPIADDEALTRYVQSLQPHPVFKGIQAEGLDWMECFTEPCFAQLDFVLSDALTFPEKDGRRVRIWEPQVTVDDEQDWMERYVDFNVQVISSEPIDILGNPTFLPNCIAGEYDALWTPRRMRRVIEAAARHGVAIELNSRYRIPSAAFVRMAKEAGVRFSFGSNEHGEKVGLLDHCLAMVRECALTPEDIFVPLPSRRRRPLR
jgi:hypothetical protein